MGTINEYILKLIPKALNNSLLKKNLDQECSDIQKAILSTQVKLWLENNRLDADDHNKDFFNLSSGKLFEHYVVSLFDTTNWKLVSWRSDKIQNFFNSNNVLKKPETNRYPDIVLEYCNDKEYNGFKKGDRIAIECKWTNHSNGSFAQCASNRLPQDDFYPKNALKDNACCFYFAIGVGWKIISKNRLRPEAVFFIPASKINNKSCKEIENLSVKRKPLLKKKESLICTKVEKNEINRHISDSINKLDNLKDILE